MKSVLCKIDEFNMKIDSFKKRKILVDNRIRQYEENLRVLNNKRLGGEKRI